MCGCTTLIRPRGFSFCYMIEGKLYLFRAYVLVLDNFNIMFNYTILYLSRILVSYLIYSDNAFPSLNIIYNCTGLISENSHRVMYAPSVVSAVYVLCNNIYL
ncbi:unnamed protein product [Chrysodeixis includens]|uniref:Uncharacterized protein n=1 Tax=Chrysodeixis includens TaxID=689277 RepID=A0A9P0BL97_CHRIL|nr:unnamed protein product [Chrysodeixis includens]